MLGRFARQIRVVCVLFGLCPTLACRKTPEPPGADSKPTQNLAPAPLASAPAPASSVLPEVEITWLDPPGLKRVPPKSPMRKASYEVPRAPGDTEDGELAVFYFGPGQGGSIDANVDRWVKQFSDISPDDIKRADREANGLRQHTVDIASGTFDAGQMGMASGGGPKMGYALAGAIVEAPSGAYFFKMTGPARTVAAAHRAFLQMLDSVRAGG